MFPINQKKSADDGGSGDSATVFYYSSTTLFIPHSLTHGRLAFSALSSLFVGRLGRYLRFCPLLFEKEAIVDGCKSKNVRYLWAVLNFK